MSFLEWLVIIVTEFMDWVSSLPDRNDVDEMKREIRVAESKGSRMDKYFSKAKLVFFCVVVPILCAILCYVTVSYLYFS